jgi:hypothetical protein
VYTSRSPPTWTTTAASLTSVLIDKFTRFPSSSRQKPDPPWWVASYPSIYVRSESLKKAAGPGLYGAVVVVVDPEVVVDPVVEVLPATVVVVAFLLSLSI